MLLIVERNLPERVETFSVTRRDFLRISAAIGTAAAIELYTADLRQIFTKAIDGEVHVVWMQGAQDTGCTVSLLQGSNPDLIDVITDFRLAVDFHPAIMLKEGEEAVKILSDAASGAKPADVFIMEGAIPEGYFCTVGEIDGKPVPLEDWVKSIGGRAKYAVAVGQCATYGGIPASPPNPTNCKPLSKVLTGKTVINVPGCPPHPDWMTLTLAQALQGMPIELDKDGRPKAIFKGTVHETCPRLGYYEQKVFAKSLDDPECLYKLGCKGPVAQADCTLRRWNQGVNACPIAGSPCRACVEKGWPDAPFAPFYEEYVQPPQPVLEPTLAIGAATAVAAIGAGAYVARRRMKKRVGE